MHIRKGLIICRSLVLHSGPSGVQPGVQGGENYTSKQYREGNTHGLYGKYGAYVKPTVRISNVLFWVVGHIRRGETYEDR